MKVFTNFFNQLTNGAQKSIRKLWDNIKKKRIYKNINNLKEAHHNLIGDLASFPSDFARRDELADKNKIIQFARKVLVDFLKLGRAFQILIGTLSNLYSIKRNARLGKWGKT